MSESAAKRSICKFAIDEGLRLLGRNVEIATKQLLLVQNVAELGKDSVFLLDVGIVDLIRGCGSRILALKYGTGNL